MIRMDYIDVYVVTFNCGREKVKPKEFGPELFNALPKNVTPTTTAQDRATTTAKDDEQSSEQSSRGSQEPHYPHLLVLCLQEVAPIAYSYLGGRFLTPYVDAFREAVDVATEGRDVYELVVRENTGMTGILVFARKDVVRDVAWVEVAGAGVGVQETGHKGAAGVRLGYSVKDADRAQNDGTESNVVGLTFVAAHLAPGEAFLKRRNEDWRNLARLMVFSSKDNQDESQSARREEDQEPLLQMPPNTRGLYSPSSYLFVAGDFNYRTASARPRPADSETFPQPTDDSNSPVHYSHLLARDQLTRERVNQRAFHNLSEMPVTFPPTYKIIHLPDNAPKFVHQAYNWAKNRWPSWCDRVLYLDPSRGFEGLKPHSYQSLPVMSTSDHLPVALHASVALRAIPPVEGEETIQSPFEIDAKWQSKRASARRKEVIAGALFYLGLTREGRLLSLFTVLVLGLIYHFMA